MIDVITIRVVLGHNPTKKRTNTMVGKKAKPSDVSEPSHHSVFVKVPTRKFKKVASPVSVKKSHSMRGM